MDYSPTNSFIIGEYFCRVSNPKTCETKKENMESYPKEFCDSSICKVKVVLPNKDQITNGEVKFLNEEIRILEQPDIANSEIKCDVNSSPTQRIKNINLSRRAAIGDKVQVYMNFYYLIYNNNLIYEG